MHLAMLERIISIIVVIIITATINSACAGFVHLTCKEVQAAGPLPMLLVTFSIVT